MGGDDGKPGEGGGPGKSRLDGLVGLLEKGTTPGLRKMAARQIGDVAAAHPMEVRELVRRVRKLLVADSWETRVAAGQAIAAMAEVTPRWRPAGSDGTVDGDDAMNGFLRFDTFDLRRVLKEGAILFGSSGAEFSSGSSQENVAEQREKLKKELGIDDRFGSSEDVLGLKDEDLEITGVDQTEAMNRDRKDVDAIVAEMEGNGADPQRKLSSRERNRLKREAKRMSRSEGTPSKRPRKSKTHFVGDDGETTGMDQLTRSEPQHPWDEYDDDRGRELKESWVFETTCELLMTSLMNPRWEMRHGAAIGLREILKTHASSAGRKNPDVMGDKENARWLEDLSCRLLCVLALDRFGDFVGDGVVAPVRETAAMTIAASSQCLPSERVSALLQTLQIMFSEEYGTQWEIRHAGLLGIRYVLAAKHEDAEDLLPKVLDSILKGLSDADDDVRAAAGSALLPVTSELVRLFPDRVPDLMESLWDSVSELEDISSSTSVVFRLLADLSGRKSPQGQPKFWIRENDSEASNQILDHVPRLWPFLRHSSRAVRLSVSQVLEALVLQEEMVAEWVSELLGDILDKIFMNLMLENDGDILQIYRNLWKSILSCSANPEAYRGAMIEATAPNLKIWFVASAQTTRAVAAKLFKAKKNDLPTGMNDVKPKRAPRRSRKTNQSLTEQHAVTVEGPDEWMQMQIATSWALGLLCAQWAGDDSRFREAIASARDSDSGVSRRFGADVLRYFLQYAKRGEREFKELIDGLHFEMLRSDGHKLAELGHSAPSICRDTGVLLQAMMKISPISMAPSSIEEIKHYVNIGETIDAHNVGESFTRLSKLHVSAGLNPSIDINRVLKDRRLLLVQ